MKACEINVKDLNPPTMVVELYVKGRRAFMFRLLMINWALWLIRLCWYGPVRVFFEENEEQPNKEKP